MTQRWHHRLNGLALAAWLGLSALQAFAAPKALEPPKPPPAAAVKEVKLNRQQQSSHVAGTPEHLNRIKQGKPTSTFFGARSGEALTRKTWETGTAVPGRPQMRERLYPHTTGVSPQGGFQRGVRVSINKRGEIHGYPYGPEVK